MKQPYNTALYMRLSRDDENYGDSVSIETQRTILRQFAKENQLHVVDEYIDDGWSGTNFERPNFKRMMEDVELGKINCIVTKDLSRFGREHIGMDYYLEFVFPEKNTILPSPTMRTPKRDFPTSCRSKIYSMNFGQRTQAVRLRPHSTPSLPQDSIYAHMRPSATKSTAK